MAAREEVKAELPLGEPVRDPCAGVTYIHNTIEERLLVISVACKSVCRFCQGRRYELVNDRRRACRTCQGSGEDKGLVLCRHADGESRRQLSLWWEFDEFLDNFRRADGRYETGELF